ncbi:MAG: hypothetical protein OEV42_00665 [Deltaproteobacteria bacterium]|nr:hypothetical protein [Deltaproteobacteria bacterium]
MRMLREIKFAIVWLLGALLFASSPFVAYSAVPSIDYLNSLNVVYPGRSVQDASGNIYVVDARKSAVHKFDKYGNAVKIITSIAQPAAVAAGANGEVFIASYSGIYTVNPAGDIALFIAAGEINSPLDMAVDSAGYLYVVDSASRNVKVFTSSGSFSFAFGDVVRLVTDLNLDGIDDGCTKCYPVSVDVKYDEVKGIEKIRVGYTVEWIDANNNNAMIVTFDISGAPAGYMGTPFKPGTYEAAPAYNELTKVNGLATDSAGRIYVADNYARRVVVFSEEGSVLTVLPLESIPSNVMVDHFDRLFVSAMNGRVDIYSIDGKDVPNAVPTTPYFISPVGGDIVKTATPTLIAANATDANGDILTYEFEVSSNLSMTDIVWKLENVAQGENGMTSATGVIPLGEDTKYYWRVRSFDGKAYSPYSQVTFFVVNSENSAPLIDVVSPSIDVLSLDVGSSIGFNVSGHDPDGDNVIVQWYVDGQLVLANENTFEFMAASGDAGLHSIEVRLSDSKVYTGRAWSVTVYRENTAPVAPAALAPVDGVDINQLRPELVIQNSAPDREGDSLSYTFEVSTVSDFSNIVSSVAQVREGEISTSTIIADDLLENTFYYWRAKACEIPLAGSFVSNYYCSAPSATASFFVNTTNDKATMPGISSPADGTEVALLSPLLVVTASKDADINDTLTYDFDVATDSNFLNIIAGTRGVSAVGGSASWTVDVELSDNTSYYWRSRSVDNNGLAGDYSVSWFFVNTANDAPSAPLALWPASGIEILTTLPMLKAGNGADPDRDALVYIFEVDKVNTFDSGDLERSSLIAEDAENTTWIITKALVENTRYYWRVKASDGFAESPWSSTETFFVNLYNDAPSSPVLMSPLNGVAVNVLNPELAIYDAADADADRLSYIYEIANDSAFVSPAAESGPSGNRWFVSDGLIENEFYYWRAKAVDEHGLAGQWSQPGSFKVNIANDPPTAPVIYWQSFLPSENVVLEIDNSFDADGDLLTYDIEIYRDMSMKTEPDTVTDIPEAPEVTPYDVGVLEKGTYYWRARAFDGTVYSTWSGVRMIIVNKGAVNSNPRTDKAYGRKRF